MRFALYSNLLSPHTAPLAQELISHYGDGVYVCQKRGGEPFRTSQMAEQFGDKLLYEEDSPARVASILENADVVLTGVRDFELMERRVAAKKVTLYQSERWFKPENLFALGRSEYGGFGIWVDGFWKNLFPFAIKRAKRIMRLFESNSFLYLPIGVHAARDMVRMCGAFGGDYSCVFRSPKLEFERCPGGSVWCREESHMHNNAITKCLERSRMWGYFVASSAVQPPRHHSRVNKVLWVGRMLRLKCVDTIIKAVGNMPSIQLLIVGNGPDEPRIRNIATRYTNVSFLDMIRNEEVRKLMREYDTYIFSSNSFDGWGAVVNEALEEGMRVYGTYEAGSSATMLPDSNLFHAQDWKRLRKILTESNAYADIGVWSVKKAAKKLVEIIDEVLYGV